MRLISVLRYCFLVGLVSAQNYTLWESFFRGSKGRDNNRLFRNLQDMPPISPEILWLFVAIQKLAVAIGRYETPIAIRFTNYQSSVWWNCIAVYSTDYKDALTRQPPAIQVPTTNLPDNLNQERGKCMIQGIVTYNHMSLPEAVDPVVQAISGENPFGIVVPVEAKLDDDVEACGSNIDCLKDLAVSKSYSSTIMGHIVAKLAYFYSIEDGFNQLGKDDGCVVNCRAYKDVTGYTPVNNPWVILDFLGGGVEEHWEPLLEDNGKGFFYRHEHVTPHIGTTAKFRYLPESERNTRIAEQPNYSKSRFNEAVQVLSRMTHLDDEKKIEVEVFDDKLRVANGILAALIQNLIGSSFQDPNFAQQEDGIIVSLERFVHFATGYVAAEYDAIVIAWKEKVNYDLVRPTSVIKKLGHVTTWAPGGVRTFLAKDFEAYIRVMPHSEYVSGSACLFQAIEEYITGYMEEIGLDTPFPVTFEPVMAGESKVEPGMVPTETITLSYDSIADMAASGSESRLNGGMHFEDSVPKAIELCSGIGVYCLAGIFDLY